MPGNGLVFLSAESLVWGLNQSRVRAETGLGFAIATLTECTPSFSFLLCWGFPGGSLLLHFCSTPALSLLVTLWVKSLFLLQFPTVLVIQCWTHCLGWEGTLLLFWINLRCRHALRSRAMGSDPLCSCPAPCPRSQFTCLALSQA